MSKMDKDGSRSCPSVLNSIMSPLSLLRHPKHFLIATWRSYLRTWTCNSGILCTSYHKRRLGMAELCWKISMTSSHSQLQLNFRHILVGSPPNKSFKRWNSMWLLGSLTQPRQEGFSSHQSSWPLANFWLFFGKHQSLTGFTIRHNREGSGKTPDWDNEPRFVLQEHVILHGGMLRSLNRVRCVFIAPSHPGGIVCVI